MLRMQSAIIEGGRAGSRRTTWTCHPPKAQPRALRTRAEEEPRPGCLTQGRQVGVFCHRSVVWSPLENAKWSCLGPCARTRARTALFALEIEEVFEESGTSGTLRAR